MRDTDTMPNMRHISKIEGPLTVLQLAAVAGVIYAAIAAGADRWLTTIGLGLATFALLVMALGADMPAKRITCGMLAFLGVLGAVMIRFA